MISLSEFLEGSQNPAPETPPRTAGGDPDSSVAQLELDHIPVEKVDVRDEMRIVALSAPRSPGADRFRYLRMRLRELRGVVKLKTLVITSALPDDGKSTVALNLATALAERGRCKVLLMEADLHRPSLANRLGIPLTQGLAECLEDGLSPFSAIKRLEPLQWYLLQAGEPKGNPTELLQLPDFGHLIEQLAPYFDWIVLDTPPVAPLSDALLATRNADAALLVVRANQTPRTAVDEALSLLGPQHVAGVILNQAEHLNRLYTKYSGYYGRK